GLLTHALKVALEHDESPAALRAYHNLADTLCNRDAYEEALQRYDEGLALGRKIGNRMYETSLLLESAYPLLLLGRWDAAAARFAEVPEAELDGGAAVALVGSAAELAAARGHVEEAEHVLAIGARFEHSTDVQERSAYAAAS